MLVRLIRRRHFRGSHEGKRDEQFAITSKAPSPRENWMNDRSPHRSRGVEKKLNNRAEKKM